MTDPVKELTVLKELLELFATFARVGAMTFGGGYAMLPILQREVVENKGWATEEELADCYAVGQCTPGIIAVNTATFIGQKQGGVPGAVAATAGIVFPSFLIISALAGAISAFADLPAVQEAFAGVRVCVAVLVFNAVVKLWRSSVVDRPTLAIFALVFLGAVCTDISAMAFVLAAGAAGLALSLGKRGGRR